MLSFSHPVAHGSFQAGQRVMGSHPPVPTPAAPGKAAVIDRYDVYLRAHKNCQCKMKTSLLTCHGINISIT